MIRETVIELLITVLVLIIFMEVLKYNLHLPSYIAGTVVMGIIRLIEELDDF